MSDIERFVERYPASRYASHARWQSYDLRNLSEGAAAPAFEVRCMDGTEFDLARFNGSVVLVEFGSTAEPEYLTRLDGMRRLVGRLQGRPFVLISMHDDSDRSTIEGLRDVGAISWCFSFHDSGSSVFEAYHVQNTPTLFLIDHRGIIQRRWKSVPPEGALSWAIDTLVSEAEAARK